MKKITTTNLKSALASKKAIVLFVLLVLVAATALFLWRQQEASNANRVAQVKTIETETIEAAPGNLLALEDVETIAKSRNQSGGSASIATIELEEEHGIWVYKVQLTNGTMLFIDAQTGKNAAHHYENRAREAATDDTLTLPANFAPGINFTEARNIATSKKPNSTIERIKFETEHGVTVYSVRFTDDSRVDIDAADGSIVRTEPAKDSDARDSDDSRDSRRDDSDDRSDDSRIDDSGEDFGDDSFRRNSDDN